MITNLLKLFHAASVSLVFATLLGGTAIAADKVTFGVPNPSGLSDGTAHFAYAMELGYFKQENLDVEFVNFAGSAVLLPQVATKAIDIGWGGPDILITAKQPGRDAPPLRFVYNWLRASVWEFVVLESSPIKTLADLKGKKVGVNFLSGGQIPQTKATLIDAGLQPGRDVDLIATGYGPPAFLALNSGQVDALCLFEGQHIALENRGTKLRRLHIPDKFSKLFSDGFYAHEDTIKNRGTIVARFGRAVTKGIVACDANPQGCVQALWKAYPNKRPVDANGEKALQGAIRGVKARFLRVMPEQAAIRRFGEFPEQPWRDYLQIFKDTGLIATTNVPLDQFYTNQFVDEYNKFDLEEVRKQARGAK